MAIVGLYSYPLAVTLSGGGEFGGIFGYRRPPAPFYSLVSAVPAVVMWSAMSVVCFLRCLSCFVSYQW